MADKKILTKDVLKVIAAGGLIVASVAIPNLPIALGAAYKLWKDVNRKELGRIIKRLEKQEMISFREKGNTVEITITEKGKRRLLAYNFDKMQLKAKQRDGKWRLIIFDIPEDKKLSRDAFRRKLLEFGMLRLQDSVFVSAFPCKNEIDFVCHFLEISDYVALLTLDKIERGEQLLFKEFYQRDF